MKSSNFLDFLSLVASAGRSGRLPALALLAIAISAFIACSDSNTGKSEAVATTQSALSGGIDPVVRYGFNESSGTLAADSSGNGHSATLQNGATFVAGARGNAVRINGGSQRVALPAGIVERCEDLTIAARVNLAANSANWTRIFDFGADTTKYMFLTPRAGAANILRFGITTSGGAGEQLLSHTFTFPTNAWKHVAVVLSGNTGTMYLDGVQVAQSTNITLDPSVLGATANNWLGDSQFSADPTLNGSIDDLVVSCRPYSAAEVAWLANGSDPAAQYTFNETSGTTAADSSGNARTATLANGASFVTGLHGNAVQIAGGTQRVNLPTGIVQACTDLTIAAHVRLATNAANWARIFDIGASGTSYMFLTPRADASNILRFAITTGGGATEQRLSHTFTFPTNAWKHVAVTLSGNTGTLYLDGVQVAQSTSMTLNPSALGATANNWLGDSQFAADPTLNGTIDNLLISCRAFSPSEISGLAGACTSAANCNDGNPCTADTCSAGFCSRTRLSDGTACANNTVCDGAESCQNGWCAAGTPPTIDDGNACTTDACDPVQGVRHTPITGGACGGAGAGGAGGTSGAGGSGAASGSSGTGGGVTCPTGTTSVEMFIELPPGVSRNQVALASYGSLPLEVHDRVRVLATSTTFSSVSSLSTNPTIPTALGVESHVQNVWAEPKLDLRDRSHVHGDAVSPGTITLLSGAVVDGQKRQESLTPHRRESWLVCHPNQHQGSIDVQPSQVFPSASTRLNPGAWGTLSVKTGGRLRLRGGTTYYFESLAIEPGAIVDLDTAAGGTQLYFRNGGFFRGTQERTDVRANVLFGVESGNFTIGGSFRGTVVAPRGLVDLPTASGGHKGSFFGKQVIAHQATDITNEPVDTTGMCPPNAPCSGLCPCHGGGGGTCNSDADCAAGLVCPRNNGGCFGLARSERRCWPAQCMDGIDPEAGECGQPDSPCGPVCGCAKPCNAEDPVDDCPAGEECTPKLGRTVGIHSRDACGPTGPDGPICPSDDPALCGDDFKICGRHCICVPDCSAATPLNPTDGCRGLCPGVCPIGLKGCCSQDFECANGGICLMDPDGQKTCRPGGPNGCGNRPLRPPLCGTPNAMCGPECPHCIPRCEGRQCGVDPNCGESCGSCPGGQWCDSAGQCRTPTSEPPIGDVPDLPPAPAAAVGPVPGSFTVTDQGTAQYTIPIDVPPGRLGMTPALALVYQATRDNGSLGIGWRIDGLSKISRCPKNFAADGYTAAVKNDSTDALCLDGKRLVAIANASAPGGDGTEYRTQIDSFAKIVSRQDSNVQPDPRQGIETPVARSEQGPDTFEVRTKDGRIMTFGGTIDSLVVRPSGVRQTWLLRKIEDRTGNSILYRYDNAGSHVMPPLADGRVPTRLHPTEISYTGRGETPGTRRVVFTHETRPDPGMRFLQGGIAWTLDDRLRRITTYIGEAAVKNYRLSYRDADFSMIETITECEGAADLRCKPATKFDYAVGDSGFDGPDSFDGQVSPGGQLDVNGDGFPDFFETTVNVEVDGVDADPALVAAQVTTDIVVGIGANLALPAVGWGFSMLWSEGIGPLFFGMFADEPEVRISIEDRLSINPQIRHQPFQLTEPSLPCHFANSFADYNRDGRDDIVAECSQSGLTVSLSDGNGQFTGGAGLLLPLGTPPWRRVIDSVRVLPIVRDLSFGPSPVFYDIDGDSLQDVVSCRDECTIELRRRLSPSGGFAEPIELSSSNCESSGSGSAWTLLGEVGTIEPFCATEVPEGSGPQARTRMNKPSRTVATFDVDADGTPDLLNALPPPQGSGPHEWRVLRYVVSGGVPRIEWQPVEFPNVNFASHGDGLQIADFNDDGLADVLMVYPGTATIWLNTGGGAFLTKQLPHQGQEDFRLNRIAVTDFNMDGRTDWIEGWQRSAPFSCLDDSRIALQSPSSDQSSFGTILNPPGLQFVIRPTVCGGTPEPLPFQMATDFDADGAVDILSERRIFYGNNRSRLLMTKIEDGLGNVTTIGYDAAGTYTNTCTGSTWPEMCLKRMSGLVSRHEEGLPGPFAGTVSVQRTFDYKYENARLSTTGHGWLGFEKRTVELVGSGIPIPENDPPETEFGVIKTTVEMEPVARYTLAGAGTEPFYVYPLAGLPKNITVDRFKAQSPLETSHWRRRTLTRNTWRVGISSAGLPFPRVDRRVTEVFEAVATEPLSENGDFLTGCTETLGTDSYGNTTTRHQICDSEFTETTTTFAPDPSAWLISNPELITVASHHSGSPRKTQIWDLEYYSNGQLLSVTRSPEQLGTASHTTTYGRNDFGNVESIIESAGGEAPRTTTITYNPDNVFPDTITNAKGQRTQLNFDLRWGVPITITDANGIVVRHSYDGLGLLADTVDPQGTTVYTYQPFDLAGIGDVPGIPLAHRPVGRGIQVSVQRQGTGGSSGGFVSTVVDSLGRPIRTTSPGFGVDFIEQHQRYDRYGRLAFATLPHAPTSGTGVVPLTSYSYDGFDRLKRITRSDGSVAEVQHASIVTVAPEHADWFGEFGCGEANPNFGYSCPIEAELTKDEEGRRDVVLKDQRGLVVLNIDGDNIDTAARFSSYRYGPFGRLEEMAQNEQSLDPAVTSDDGPHTLFTYDDYGRLLTHTDPSSGTTSYIYNGFDEIKFSNDSKSQLRAFNYDSLGRIESIVEPGGARQWIYDQGANAIGRLSETFSPPTDEAPLGQHLVYTYEPQLAGETNRGLLQRLDYVLDSTPYPVSFTYDDLGRTKTIAYPDLGSGPPVIAEYTYNSVFLTHVQETGSGTTNPIWRLDSAFEGMLVEHETFGNNVTTDYTYNEQRRFLETIQTTFGTSTLQDLAYTHYANGLIRDRFKNGTDQRLHLYDALNRLLATFDGPLGEFNESTLHAYDHLGNMTQRGATTLTYNSIKPHLLENVDTNAYLYDLNGNVQQRQGPQIPGGIQTIEYTPFDLPRTIATGLDQGTKTTKFEYSADEERLIRRDTGAGINRTRHFVTDLYQRLTDNIAGATLEERFRIYAGSREVAQIVRENGVDKTLFFHADHLGTPETITTNYGDVSHQELDPWGASTSSGSTEVTRVGFTGHEHDRDLGLVDMKGRIYDPLAARFTTADPIMQAPYWSQGLNRYAYTFNDPVNHTDPSGFVPICTDVMCVPGPGDVSTASDLATGVETHNFFVGDSSSTGSTGAGAGSAGGSGAALGSALGMAGTVINVVDKALGGDFLGQRSTPSSKSQSSSSGGSQAPTSVPSRAGADAASANKPIEAPTCNGEWGCAPDVSNTAGPYGAAPVRNGNLNALMDAAPEIGKTAPTWDNIGEGMAMLTMVIPNPAGEAGIASRGGEFPSRLGRSKESASRLARKALQAEEQIGIHGVSATAGVPKGAASQAARTKVEGAFKVHNTPTRADPLHRTVELPKPVTQQVADLFNGIFGR